MLGQKLYCEVKRAVFALTEQLWSAGFLFLKRLALEGKLEKIAHRHVAFNEKFNNRRGKGRPTA